MTTPKPTRLTRKNWNAYCCGPYLARGKAISSLNTDDCRAYIKFLKTLTTADHAWVTLQPANKSYGKWKPFYYRAKKSDPGQSLEPAELPQRVLSPKSINYAKTVIASCMEWLVKQNGSVANIYKGQAALICGRNYHAN